MAENDTVQYLMSLDKYYSAKELLLKNLPKNVNQSQGADTLLTPHCHHLILVLKAKQDKSTISSDPKKVRHAFDKAITKCVRHDFPCNH
jgi:hypothetical protein